MHSMPFRVTCAAVSCLCSPTLVQQAGYGSITKECLWRSGRHSDFKALMNSTRQPMVNMLGLEQDHLVEHITTVIITLLTSRGGD